MKRVVLAVVIVLAAVSSAGAQPRRLEPGAMGTYLGEKPPQVILLTFGVGPRIFERFGHAAICLNYETSPEPICFNYGVTNFNEGAPMVWHFLRGQQAFWVDPESWTDMIGFYQWEDRDIWEQVLPLSPEQARTIEKAILDSLLPEQRTYHYDHFFNNCTTRLRDLIDRATGGALRAGSDVAYPLTFREMGERGLAPIPQLVAIADFVIGRQTEDRPTLWQAMFHPDVLRERVKTALHVEPRLLYKRQGPAFPTESNGWRPQMLALVLIFAVPLLVATWRRRFERIATAWASLYLTLWGVVIWGLAIISSIPGVRWNENVLVLMPLDAVLPFLGEAKRRRYAQLRCAELAFVSALRGVGVLEQPIWVPVLTAFIPLFIIAFGEKIARRLA
ncbi:MAG: DUF4105 domain-containing protein [Kofleriaceae bacterium]|nr:DUF4105 domain-containing protein [Kofleriaceae bacterium]